MLGGPSPTLKGWGTRSLTVASRMTVGDPQSPPYEMPII